MIPKVTKNKMMMIKYIINKICSFPNILYCYFFFFELFKIDIKTYYKCYIKENNWLGQ